MSRYLHHISGQKTEIESRNELNILFDINPKQVTAKPEQITAPNLNSLDFLVGLNG